MQKNKCEKVKNPKEKRKQKKEYRSQKYEKIKLKRKERFECMKANLNSH